MRIFLIGFAGCGKTFLGRRSAKLLGLNFIDLDLEIESYAGISVQKLFKIYGEEKFREIENYVLKNTAELDDVVISCGGGTPCFLNNMEIIKSRGISIYLKMNERALFHRLKNSKNKRPLLESKNDEELLNKISRLLGSREKYYNQADLIFEALNSTPEQLVKVINDYCNKSS